MSNEVKNLCSCGGAARSMCRNKYNDNWKLYQLETNNNNEKKDNKETNIVVVIKKRVGSIIIGRSLLRCLIQRLNFPSFVTRHMKTLGTIIKRRLEK